MPKDNTIKMSRFTGMRNVDDAGDLFTGKETATPRIILNSDVTPDGRLIKRDGFTEVCALTSPHSLWGGSTCLLCVSQGALYQINGTTATSRGTVTNDRTFYAEVGDLVYLSNKGGC